MSWLQSFFVAMLTAVVAAVAGGWIGVLCVSWYRVSPREGGSGYFVAAIVVLSGFLGFLLGFVLSRYFGGAGTAGFFTGLGVSAGATLGLAGAIAMTAWRLADIPPTIHGHELDLVVEARLPVGAERPPLIEGKQFVFFESGEKGKAPRVTETGVLDVSKTTQIEGRWVVPGSVRIFTTRDTRFLTIALDEKRAFGFELRFPGQPGAEYQQWSGWLPDAAKDHWPESRMSYRFRIEERIPVVTPPPPDPYDALTSDSPLGEWLRFFDPFGRVPDRYQAIMKQVEQRPADLAKLIRSHDDDEYGHAMNAAQLVKVVDPMVLQAMLDVAADIEDQIRKFDAMGPQQPGYDDLGKQIQDRFHRWCAPWEMVQSRSGVDGRAPVEQILTLAGARQESVYIQGVTDDARTLLGYLAAASRKPK